MSVLSPRRKTINPASFHDASAKDAYASWFRPIAIAAVAAGTRRAPVALDESAKDKPSRLAGVLRNDFDD